MTAAITLRVASDHRKDRHSDELAAALVGFGTALDRLFIEVESLPRQGIPQSIAERLLEATGLSWLAQLLVRRLFGREAWSALNGLITATNRLLVAAPDPMLPSLLRVNETLASFEERGSDWEEEWQDARAEVFRVGRQQLAPAS